MNKTEFKFYIFRFPFFVAISHHYKYQQNDNSIDNPIDKSRIHPVT